VSSDESPHKVTHEVLLPKNRPPPITLDWVAKAELALKALWAEPPAGSTMVSRQRAIELLAPKIRELQHAHYDLNQIVARLNVDGQNFGQGAVKTYLARVPTDEKVVPEKRTRASTPKHPRSPSPTPDHPTDVGDSAPGSRLRAPAAPGDKIL